MGLFDSMAGQVLGSLTGGNGGKADPSALIGLIGNLLNDPARGGFAGLVKAFEQQGLGNIIASWIGTGSNLPISPAQLQAVLGNEQIQAFAQKLGFSPQDLTTQLADLMPKVIDQLTPDGQAPQGNAIGGLLASLTSLRSLG